MATTHVPLKGGAYQSHSVIAAAQRCLNLYPETGPTSTTSSGGSASTIGEPSVVAHYPTPGMRLLGTIGTGPIRGIRQCSTGGVYVVSGDTLYSVDVSNWTGTPLGTLTPGIRTPVSMTDNGLVMVVVDGSPNGWGVTLADNTFSPIPGSNTQTTVTAGTTAAIVAGTARYTQFVAAYTGSITSVSVTLGTGYSGTMKCAIFDADQAVLGTAGTLYAPAAGANVFYFSTPVSVISGSQYWVGFDSDTSAGTWSVEAGATSGGSSVTAFADFPKATPGASPAAAVACSLIASNDPDGIFAGADKVDYLDTFFIFNKPGTPQFYISGSLAVTFDSLDFANKAAYSDLLMTTVVCKRLIYLVGERTTEIWYESGETFSTTAGQSASVSEATAVVAFQFAPMQSEVFVDHGTIAKYSPAVYDNYMFWLTRDRQGHGAVHAIAGYESKRISTFAIEQELAGYERLWDAIGFCYRLGGHAFYVLTFPHADKTWAYDIITGLWHEWGWIDSNGSEHRHRANCYFAVNDLGAVGDWQNGNVYALDHRLFTDNGRPIKRVRAFPHLLSDGKRVFYRQFLADLETGWAPEMLGGTETRLNAPFTVPDGTALAAYTSEVGGGWVPVGSAANAQIVDQRVVGTGGTALYQSAALILARDYTLHFDVIPPVAGSVVSSNTVWATGRAVGTDTGYRVAVSADGTQYTLALATLPSGASASVAMGTIASGYFTVWLLLRGTSITAQVQRSVDRRWLRTDATWHVDQGTTAAQVSDGTYTAPGVIMLGGTWPTPPPPSTDLTLTLETPLSADPNFPSGYFAQTYKQAFDFTRNWFYQPITSGGTGGIAVTDLSTMTVLKTTTLAQMYAGTSYGETPGVTPSQTVYDVAAGNGTDLYMLAGSTTFVRRFTRIDPVTMKVTGEWFAGGGVAGQFGVVNTTATHTIAAYVSLSSAEGAKLYDGTGMAPIGLSAAPTYGNNNNMLVIAGQKRTDGSCDFLMLNSDYNHPTGNIDIWRINVSDSLTITSTKTGTANVSAIFSPTPNLYIAQADYDSAHDAVILQVTNSTETTGPPIWIMSVTFAGTINWVQSFPSNIAIPFSKGQSLLTGSSIMIGDGTNLRLLDTVTGAITIPGTVPGVSASYYRVYDASRRSYWTNALASGFVRISLPPVPGGVMLGIDNVIATASTTLLPTNLISLRWSDDRGHSWGHPVSIPIGEAGEYRTSLQWQRLGMARDRVFEIYWDVPMRTALQGCWLDAAPAQS